MNYIETVTEFPRLGEIAAEPFQPHGIPHSEMALIIAVCRAAKIQCVIESGRARAQSTYMLAKYLKATIDSIELADNANARAGANRMKNAPHVNLVHGDGAVLAPKMARAATLMGYRVAVLLDGPKGLAAIDVLAECKGAVVGFIHDMRRLDHGKPSPYRTVAELRYPGRRAFFSDDPEYVAATSWLDTPIHALGSNVTGWKPGKMRKPGSGGPWEDMGSYGPTVGVFWL